jgi:predicted MPP superfamily phosphohydrolase
MFPPTSGDLLPLFDRLGRNMAERRMLLQVEHSATLYGAGCGHLHFENVHALRVVLEALLKMSGLARRARKNCAAYQVEQVEMHFTALPIEFDGYRIVQLSDLHADVLIDQGAGIVKALSGLEYDLAVVTGDYRFETHGDYAPCLEAMEPILQALDAPDGCFGILGNHDFLEFVPSLERMGLQMLLNERVLIERRGTEILLAGVDDPHFYGAHDLSRAVGQMGRDAFTLLLAHSPEIIAEAERIGVDLYLCGHTHGGQICLPTGLPIIANTSCSYKYLSGTWCHGSLIGHTSRGVGFSTTAARFFCPPEITVYTLMRSI